MNEKDITDFIKITKVDLKLAEDFLAMWQRRNSAAPLIPSGVTVKPTEIQPPLPTNGKATTEYGGVKKLVLAAIEKCPAEYTIYNIEKILAEAGTPLKRPVIQQMLSRLVSAKELIPHVKGKGPKPAVYKK